ncbi:GNAT family N-acetyltransferase [Phenylobacterium sp.]|uniref:GNAT family N-acetyltransferase n=1 Tax=Phenylobacterium sp. TaxID=1871053 RepID=UPI00286A4CB9|nr:GNAT family N-acetyltransferase [Phenylobacterium sp.]
MPHETRTPDGYVLSDEAARFDRERAHGWIAGETYWAPGIPKALFDKSLDNSLVLGAYAPDGAMVAMARVVTDRATFGWICDVFVSEAHRGKRLGKAMMAYLRDHPDMQGVRRLHLATRYAHGLYAQYGFVPLTAPDNWMEIRGRGYL